MWHLEIVTVKCQSRSRVEHGTRGVLSNQYELSVLRFSTKTTASRKKILDLFTFEKSKIHLCRKDIVYDFPKQNNRCFLVAWYTQFNWLEYWVPVDELLCYIWKNSYTDFEAERKPWIPKPGKSNRIYSSSENVGKENEFCVLHLSQWKCVGNASLLY